MKIKLLQNIEKYQASISINTDHQIYTYSELDKKSNELARFLSDQTGVKKGERVLLLISPGFEFTAALLAIWRCSAIAVPLFIDTPAAALEYYLDDSTSQLILCDSIRFNELSSYKVRCCILNINEASSEQSFSGIGPEYDDDALIIYTSGTTAKPKGVLTTHRILEAQISTLVEAWKWEKEDVILNVLPLHHVHGLVNALLCPLYCGAGIVFLKKFDSRAVWNILTSGSVNVFMAVPTIYSKLIADYDSAGIEEQKKRTSALTNFRLMVSGSAALPVSVLERWKAISGHFLLERYGMTEIGMAISNPYEAERRAGFIGVPLPGVSVRLYDYESNKVIDNSEEAGEIQIKGPSVFKSYWQKPDATKASFTDDGWFKTGDMAVVNNGYYKILGRISSDIIKSGGYKLSALEIEETLRLHENVAECAIIGIDDEIWGETVAAVIVLKGEISENMETVLGEWLKKILPPYKIPRKIRFVNELPRNAMGKVVKNSLKELFI